MTVQQCNIRRLVAAGALVAAVTTPVVASSLTVHSGPPAQPVASCPNGPGVPVGLQGLGAFTSNCDLIVQPPAAPGAAPSAGAIIACRGLPGCLAYWVNYPPSAGSRPRATLGNGRN